MTLLGQAARLAAVVGPLRLARPGRLAGGAGEHARRAAGAGSEFWQYRPLQSGEAATRIDWRRSARSDQLYERQREEVRAARLWLWADGSGSMDFASARGLPTKRARARLLVLALALSARAAGEQVGVAGGAPAPGPQALAAVLDASQAGPWPDTAALRPGDTLVAAGDWLGVDPAAAARAMSARGVKGLLLQVVDPAEDSFPWSGAVRFEPCEAGDPALDLSEAEALRDAYRAAWAAHCRRVDAVRQLAGWSAQRHRTDAAAATALAAAARWLRGTA